MIGCNNFGSVHITLKLKKFEVGHWARLVNTVFVENFHYREQYGMAKKPVIALKKSQELFYAIGI